MIPVPSTVRVWLAVGRTDMRCGMNGLALRVRESLHRDSHAGDLLVFRGRGGDLITIIWHDRLGMLLYAKRLEKGRFVWPAPAVESGYPAPLACLLDGIDWRNPRHTVRPEGVGRARAIGIFLLYSAILREEKGGICGSVLLMEPRPEDDLPDDIEALNAAEQALRGIALGRKAWLFAGSDRGGRRAAILYSLIVTAR